MEKKEAEKIIGYRIGQRLLCVECFADDATRHKAEQNPKDPEVKFGYIPFTGKEVSVFICEHCKAIKGPSAGELEKEKPGERRGRRQDDSGDLWEMVNDARNKVFFLDGFFVCHAAAGDELSENEESGLYHILTDLEDDLQFVLDGMEMKESKENPKSQESGARGAGAEANGLLKTTEEGGKRDGKD